MYSIKKEAMNKMQIIITRVQNEHLARSMIKQIVYQRAMQITISRDQVSVFSFLQFSDFNKLIANQIEVMLMNEEFKHMN